MTVGVYSFELHLPGARSLKDKRQVVRRLKDRLRSRHNVAVLELEEHGALWQRAGLVVVSVAGRRDVLARLFESIRREAEAQVPGHLIDTGTEFIDAADGGLSGWSSALSDDDLDDAHLEDEEAGDEAGHDGDGDDEERGG